MAVLQTPVLEEERSETQEREIAWEDYPLSPQLKAILKRYRAATAKPPVPSEECGRRTDAFLKLVESWDNGDDDRTAEEIIKDIRESRTKRREIPGL